MTEKHTPGPWLIASGTSVYALNDSGSNCFYAQVQDAHTSRKELEANAKLIAAAPDLLEFAKLIVNGEGHSLREIMQQGKAAIAKATGETK